MESRKTLNVYRRFSLPLGTTPSFLAQFQKWKYSDQIHSLGAVLTLLEAISFQEGF